MEASKVTIGDKTYDLNHLGKKKKTNLRRKLIIEYIQSKPAGEYIKMEEFQRICCFSTYANAWAFVQRMIRDGVIKQYEGEKKKAFYYAVIGAVRVSSPKQVLEQLPKLEPVIPTQLNNNPDINSFVADMQALGVEFTITISNKREQ